MDFFKALWNDLVNAFGGRVQLGTNTITTLNIIVWSLFIGFLIAIIISLYNKLIIGTAVRGIIEKKAFSESDAVMLTDIGCRKSLKPVKLALQKSNTLRKIVLRAGCNENNTNTASTENAKYYIPEKFVRKAEVIYGKKGISAKNVILAIVALLIVTLAAIYFVPDLITMLNNFVKGLPSKESNIL